MPAENGTAKEDADQSQSASGEGNKETEGKDAAASESEGADSGAVVSEDIGMPILELDTVEAEGRPAHIRSGDYLENNVIHALLAEKLVDFDVLLAHGSALSMDGKAYIFMAASGTGKSTHTRLWREVYGSRVIIINDDKPMLKVSASGAVVYGTPWNGKHHLGCNASAPLGAVVDLNRDECNHMEPMTGVEAFPVLMKHSYRSKDPDTMRKIMELRRQLLDTVRFYRLGCNMSPEAAVVAYETLKLQ